MKRRSASFPGPLLARCARVSRRVSWGLRRRAFAVAAWRVVSLVFGLFCGLLAGLPGFLKGYFWPVTPEVASSSLVDPAI